ncbi:hypothetical protein AKG11_32015 [Shinella sp. SUS2]|nr:hypothetical protein AKG11_32015 [Shinella sp. SUS2]
MEDAADDFGLSLVDRAVAADRFAVGVEPLHHVVAVGIASTRFSRLNTATLPASGLVGQILQEERVHRTLEPDMQLADLALRQGEHLHVGIAHALVDAGDVFLIPADPIQRLGHDQVETTAAGIHDQRLDASALDHAGAGNGVVRVFLDNGPTLLLGMKAAHPKLVGDGRVTLTVGRIAGVDRNFQCASPRCIKRRASPVASSPSLPPRSIPEQLAAPEMPPSARAVDRARHEE